MNRAGLLVIMVIPLIYLWQCKNVQRVLSPENPYYIEMMVFEDVVCQNGEPLAKPDSHNYLYHWGYEKDTLSLEFRFKNTCNSSYRDSVVTQGNGLHIYLTDTARVHARCICEHVCLFDFVVKNVDLFNLSLDIHFYASDGYMSCLDTVLSLR